LILNKALKNQPIGIFDSGLGGLTVLKSLQKLLPQESFIYFGDTAHVPYGSKSNNTVKKYSENIMDFFLNYNIKAVIIACNTVSAVAFHNLKNKYNIPIFDVVSPSVEFAFNSSRNKKIGVIGTLSTIESNAYSNRFSEIDVDCLIKEVACPLFVPIIEEGWSNTAVARDIAKIYLNEFNEIKIDTLILGCTHYPIMAKTILNILDKNIKLIYSGEAVGNKVKKFLINKDYINSSTNSQKIEYFVSDFPKKFDELGSRFLGYSLKNVHHINID
jgi:glutamate racemase